MSSGAATLVGADLIDAVRRMNALGINRGTSGNASIRTPDGFVVTPSSVPYDQLTVDDIVAMDFEGDWVVNNADRRPSSEWRFHLDLLAARPDLGAIVHAHPTACTALATHRRGIGPFHYMVAIAGGRDIRCAPYATFGGSELSAHVVEAMTDRYACLMANHGLLAAGRDIEHALLVAEQVEVLASQYLAALQLGEPVELTTDEMDEVIAKFSAGDGYGSS